MSRRLVIDPVTRIEGHARITIELDERGEVSDAHFHVTQFRGFEKICEGRPFTEMPALMARICGICPVSHLVASAKACDALLSVRLPAAAIRLRTLLNLAQLVQSHALSFFYLASPDLLLGMDADPEQRNLFGVARLQPELARDGVKLRQFGQEIIELLAGKRIHPNWVVPGGVSAALDAERRDQMLARIPEALAIAERTLDWFRGVQARYQEEIAAFASFPTLFMGLVGPDGAAAYYAGRLRIVDAQRRVVADAIPPERYPEVIGESTEPWSYLKSAYYVPYGYPDGVYRVGPLARLNVAERLSTPRANAELARFRALAPGAVLGSFYYHYARLIEILHGVEAIKELLEDPEIVNPRVRAHAEPNALEGIGMAEAPRGTLLHHYRIDEDGLIVWANLLIATGHNNLAMNRGVLQAAKRFVRGDRLEEGMLNRVEATIRTFDPCLSCSTHAVGKMPLRIQLLRPDGSVADELRRD